ncbi:MAG: HD domain-containing protein [Lachnospiraceae bacterium]|nr:HD domain-containing protein [Lachnospiraceae bacterium]
MCEYLNGGIDMALVYYVTMFVISCIGWVVFEIHWKKKSFTYFSNMFGIIAISNAGSLALALSQNVDTAILANKLAYVGGVFMPLMILLNIANLCKIKVRRFVAGILFTVASVVYGFILTAGYSTMYYKSVDIKFDDGIAYIEKDYGFLHKFFSIYLYTTMILCIVLIIYAFKRQNKISYRNNIILMGGYITTLMAYIMKKVTGSIIDYVPLSFALFSIVLYYIYYRTETYDVGTLILDTMEEKSYGYIVIDNKNRFVGCNEVAKKYVSFLSKLKIDEELENEYPLFQRVKKEIEEFGDKEQVIWYIHDNDMDIKCLLRKIYYNTTPKGFMVEMSDDTQQQEYIKLINNYNTQLEEEVNKKTKSILDIQNKIIFGMANVVESRDNNTGGHIKRTSDVVRIFVNKLQEAKYEFNTSDSFFDNVIKAAPMHDLGKIGIPDNILLKPGKFTDEEYEIMKEHAHKGVAIIDMVLEGVQDIEFIQIAKNMAHYHHEKYDGNGYPEKISGESIPLESRIMALADVFDALVSKRCYKEKMPYDKAFSIIKESIGNHFDPKLGEIFLECRQQLEEYYDTVES